MTLYELPLCVVFAYLILHSRTGQHNVLQVGDEILEINKTEFLELQNHEAMKMMSETPRFVQIVVCRAVRKEVHRDREVAVVNPTSKCMYAYSSHTCCRYKGQMFSGCPRTHCSVFASNFVQESLRSRGIHNRIN